MAYTLKQQIEQLYIAWFNRVPDVAGLDYWFNLVDSGDATLDAVNEAFASTPEARAKYPSFLSNAEFVQEIFQNVLERDAEQDAVDWLSGLLEADVIGRDEVIKVVLAAANTQPGDMETLANKIEVADYAIDAQLDGAVFSAAELEAFVDNVNSDPATVDAAKASIDEVSGGGAYELTVGADVASANEFVSQPELVPGTGYINTLSDLDSLTGTGDNPTLNVTIGGATDINDSEDEDSEIIQPTLSGIQTINTEWVSNDANVLNLADADAALTTVLVNRVTASNASVEFSDMGASVINLGLANATTVGDVDFGYREEVLTGTETLGMGIQNVRVNELHLYEEGDSSEDEGHFFETINVGTSGVNDLDFVEIQSNNSESDKSQTLNIVAGPVANAGGSLEINDLHIYGVDEMVIVANQDVVIAEDPEEVLDEDNDGISSGDLDSLRIFGASDVTIDGLDGSDVLNVSAGTMTGDLAVGVSGYPAGSSEFQLTSGSGSDDIRIYGSLGGDVTTNAGHDAVWADDMYGTASVDTGAGDDYVAAYGDMEAIADPEAAGNQSFGEAFAASIVTGDGDDSVRVDYLDSAYDWNNGPSLLDQSDDTYYMKGASIDTGAGIDDVELLGVAEGASVSTGAGADSLLVDLQAYSYATTILAADSSDDAERGLSGAEDLLGAVVDLGADDDVASFVESASYANNANTIVGNDAELRGGDGTDTLNVTVLDRAIVAASTFGTTDDTNATVLGVETANLTIANQVDASSASETGYLQNDNKENDGRIDVDVARFDDALQAINLRSEEQALKTTVNTEVWDEGTATTFNVQNLRSDVAMSLSANEATGVNGSAALQDDSKIDVYLNVDFAAATGDADSFTLDVGAPNAEYTNVEDVDLSLNFGSTSTNPVAGADNRVENVEVNLEAGGSHFIDVNGFGDAQFANSGLNGGSFMQWRNINPANPAGNWDQDDYDAIPAGPVTGGSYAAPNDLTDFGQGRAVETSFSINGTAAGETVTVVDVTADAISILGDSDVNLVIGEYQNNYSVVTGAGNDVIDMIGDLVDDEDAVDGGAGRNTLVIDGNNSMGFDDGVQRENDEVWANKSNLQVLRIVTSGTQASTLVLDEETFDTGIDTINVVSDGSGGLDNQSLAIIIGEDFTRNLDLNTDGAVSLTNLSVTNSQDQIDSDLNVALWADGGASFTLDDAYNRIEADLTVHVNDGGASTYIAGDADAGGLVDGEVDVNVTNGAINSITLVDSVPTDGSGNELPGDNGGITVIVDNGWSGSTLVVDASGIANNDANEDLGVPNSNPATPAELAADYAVSITTGGMFFNGTPETDATLVVRGTANNDSIYGGSKGDTLNGGAGNDVLVGDIGNQLNNKVASVTFAASYNAGDLLNVTVNGVGYTLLAGGTVTGAQIAAAFADYITDSVDNIAADNIAISGAPQPALGAGALALATASGVVLTLTGATAGNDFTLSASTTDATNAVAQNQTLDLDVTDGGDWAATVVWNGTTYDLAFVGGAINGGIINLFFDVGAAGGNFGGVGVADNTAGTVALHITGPADGSAFPLITQVTEGVGVTDARLAYAPGTANTLPDQADPALATLTPPVVELGGNDTINGGDDDDYIQGGAGNDTLNGDAGDDVIFGGAGGDALNGGDGHDVFIYQAAAESSGLVEDTITGFTGGTVTGGTDGNLLTQFDNYTSGDVIDLSGVLAASGLTGVVEFLGTFADDTVADTQLESAGQGNINLQVVYVSGDNALYVDYNNSGDIDNNDMAISLVGLVGNLTQANFNDAAISA